MMCTSRIIDERYPNYESVIPLENDKQLTVNRPALIAAVQRCSIFSNAITNQIRFSVAKEELRVSAEDMDIGGEAREIVRGAFSVDEDLEIGFVITSYSIHYTKLYDGVLLPEKPGKSHPSTETHGMGRTPHPGIVPDRGAQTSAKPWF